LIFPCVARPGMGFIHLNELCHCFTGGPRPEFPPSSGVPKEEDMRRTKNGSYEIKKFEIFLNVGFWRWGSYNIGSTRVLQRGPLRIFVRNRHE